MEGLGRMMWKWCILAKNMSLMLLLIISLCLWEKSGSQQAKEVEIFHKILPSLSRGLFVRKKDTLKYTHVSSIHANGVSVDAYKDRNRFVVNIFLQWNYNKASGGNFGVTPFLVATIPLRNNFRDELHTSQYLK